MKKIIISGGIGWEIKADEIIDQLNKSKGDDIEVHLASPGGSVFEGIEIYNAFRDYKRKYPKSQMMLTIKGLAASMASYIAVNPAFDLVFAEDNAVFMIHNVQGGAIGDYREMKKTAEVFEGLTDLLSQAYSKKNGKSKKEIRSLMDDETWYFGDEILESGYVDEILKTDDKKEKQSAVASAKLNYQNMIENVNQKIDIYQIAAMIDPQNPYPNEHAARVRNPEDFQADSFRRKNIETGIDIIIGRLKGKTTTTTQAYRFKKDKFTVAEAKKWLKDHDVKYISFEPASGSDDSAKNPADVAGNNITEVKSMLTLKDFLDENPAAKIEIENMFKDKLKEEYKAGFQAGKEEVQNKFKAVSNYIAPDSAYGASVKKTALDVLKGEKSLEALETLVAAIDALKEETASTAARDETAELGETPGEHLPQPSADGVIKNDIDFQALINQAKIEKGMEVT